MEWTQPGILYHYEEEILKVIEEEMSNITGSVVFNILIKELEWKNKEC